MGCWRGRRRRRKISREIFLPLLLLFDGGRRILIRLRRDFPSGLLRFSLVFANASSGNLRLPGKFNFSILKFQFANCKSEFQIPNSKALSTIWDSSANNLTNRPKTRRQLEEIEDSVEEPASKVSPAEQSLNQVLAAVTNWAVAAAQSLDLMDSFLLYPAARSTHSDQPWKSSFQSFFGSK